MEGIKGNANAIVVSESYQNYQNLAVSYQLTDVGKGESVLGVAMNLLMCDMIGALTVHVHATVNNSVSAKIRLPLEWELSYKIAKYNMMQLTLLFVDENSSTLQNAVRTSCTKRCLEILLNKNKNNLQ